MPIRRRTDSPRRAAPRRDGGAANAACNEKNTGILSTVPALESDIDCTLPITGSYYFRSCSRTNETASARANKSRLKDGRDRFAAPRRAEMAAHNYREICNLGARLWSENEREWRNARGARRIKDLITSESARIGAFGSNARGVYE